MKQITLTNDPKALINYYEKFRNNVGKYVLFDTIVGANVTIDVLMYHLIRFYVKERNLKSIVDPTCGLENIMFRNIIPILKYWNIEYKPCDIKADNWACKNGYPNCICDVFKKETLPKGEVWVYDPPYVPKETVYSKNRKEEYDMNGIPVIMIKRYYSEEVFNNFIENGAKLIIVKGASFYYPTDTDHFYCFERDIINPSPRMRLIGRIIYRYYIYTIPLNNSRLGNSAIKRLQPVSTTFMIFRVV